MNRQNIETSRSRSDLTTGKRGSQELLDKAYRLARIGTWDYNMNTGKLTWSNFTKELHGFDEDYEPDVESTINLFEEGYHRDTFGDAARNAIEKEVPFDVELKIISGKGDERWIRATGEPEFEDGKCVRFYGISQDVTTRKKAQEDLQHNEQRFRVLVQDGSDMIAILDDQANYIYASPTSERILGIPPETLIGKNALDFIHEDDTPNALDVLAKLETEKRIEMKPFRFKNSEGNWRWIETTLTNMKDDAAIRGVVANSRDITERKQQEELLQESLKEKETLLAEIHHRVKNNLSMVTGLLQVQVSREREEDVVTRLEDNIARIQTMAQIHEQLYNTSNFKTVDLEKNIRALVMNLVKTYQAEVEVDVEFNCSSVHLNTSQAIPCSLILSEVVTNIFKHAFKGRTLGKMIVSLEESVRDQVRLQVIDNGVGLPDTFKSTKSETFGHQLIEVLSAQLGGSYDFASSSKGTVFTLSFAHKS